MEKDRINQNISVNRLSHNDDFYTNVFKRVEKLVSVIFYIVSYIDIKDINNVHVERIKDKSLSVHETALGTLELQAHAVEEGVETLQFTLMKLDSTLRVAVAAQALPQNLFALAVEQIDGVQRYLNNHYRTGNEFTPAVSDQTLPGQVTAAATPTPKKKPVSAPRPKKVVIPEGDISTDAYLVYSQLTDRAERIKTVLEAKPQASIKDIAEVITDISEKTIQRELNDLIEKGQVIREGERRWSKYSVAV